MASVHEVMSNADLPAHHPLRRVSMGLRLWLSFVAVSMIWNAAVANEIILPHVLRPIPFLVLAAVAIVWLLFPWSGRVTILCSSVIAVGVVLRGMEVVVFGGDIYDARARATAASIWVLLGSTALVFGFLNLVAISRRSADLQVWGRR